MSKKRAKPELYTLEELTEKHLDWMKVNNYAERTIENRRWNLTKFFLSWSRKKNILKATDVTSDVLDKYQKYLYRYRKKDGKGLHPHTQVIQLYAVQRFFSWLAKKRHILYNPASEIEPPKKTKQLPGDILTAEEVEKILSNINTSTWAGLRDRAIVETFYSTGMRRKELLGLRVQDIYTDRGTIFVHGKGSKDRVIPIGKRAFSWIERYLEEARPFLLNSKNTDILFINKFGQRLSKDGLTHCMRAYIKSAGIEKSGSCHVFRHTMATLMMENGADIRYIQEMLGHASLDSTKVYTRVSIAKLKEVHTRTHPARLKKA